LLHRVDPSEIRRDVVIAAALPGGQMEAAAGERHGAICTAEMNDRGELLLLLQTRARFGRPAI
jgi:hypothetical protein